MESLVAGIPFPTGDNIKAFRAKAACSFACVSSNLSQTSPVSSVTPPWHVVWCCQDINIITINVDNWNNTSIFTGTSGGGLGSSGG
jgi:hypothetical protein